MIKQLINLTAKIPLVNSYYSGIATIFMLHRVAPYEENKLFPNENMKVSPGFLEKFILELKERGYEFISIDTLYDILHDEKDVKKKIVLSLDDGYKDNYEIAYPIFKKHDIPFTIYITTSFPNESSILWWYVLEELIVKNEMLKIGDTVYSCNTYTEKNDTFMKVREQILKLDQRDILHKLQILFKNYDIDWFSKNEELCMSWSDIKKLSKDSLCTIGGHTVNHYAFNKLRKEDILKEIVDANTELETHINKKVEHFAYPFGSRFEVGDREVEFIKKLNFKTVTTTRAGNIYHKHKQFANCCLPRIMLTENFQISDIGKVRRKRIATV